MAATDTPIYEIRVTGRLGSGWGAWFDGLEVTSDADGTSVIRGPVVDQSALHGLSQKLRDLGLVLESLAQVEAVRDVPTTNNTNHTNHTNPTGATS